MSNPKTNQEREINQSQGDNTMSLPVIQDNKDLKQAVDAKELYRSLGLNSAHWAKWHSRNIDNNPFAVEGEDYQGFTQWVSGNKTKNYLLSIHFAKKLAMQVRTEKGEQVRNYFLECEDLAKRQAAPQLPDFTNPVAAARAWADEFEAKQVALAQLEQAQPKIQHYDTVVERDTLLNATTVAHSVGLKSAQALNKQLERLGVYNATCKRGRAFRAWFIEQGLGAMKQGATGHHQTLFTTKGQAWVIENFGGDA